MGYRITNPCWTERPDAVLTISNGKSRRRVGIEHTDYYNDTQHGKCSKLTYLDEFWRRIQSSLKSRISHRKKISNILANVTFKTNVHISRNRNNRNQEARDIAKELVLFTIQNPPSKDEWSTTRELCVQDFPKLHLYCSKISLYKRQSCSTYTHCTWRCTNTTGGHIGLKIDHVKSAVVNKNNKAVNYSWENVDEKWLLISASGSNVSTSAGPDIPSDKWIQPDLIAACSTSIFDRIYFFEYVLNWHREIWPNYRP